MKKLSALILSIAFTLAVVSNPLYVLALEGNDISDKSDVEDSRIVDKVLSSNIEPITLKKGQLVVRYKDHVDSSTKDEIKEKLNGELEERLPNINADIINIEPGTSPEEVKTEIKNTDEIESIEPNYYAQTLDVPNDVYYNYQWNLQKIQSSTAYTTAQSSSNSAVVAIVDTGVNGNHPDLAGEVIGGYNAINGTANYIDDNGHGTRVAGVAAAVTNNSTGIASASYKTSILAVKVLDQYGWGTYTDIAKGINYAADHGARVISLSLGGMTDSQVLRDAVTYAQSKGSIVVAAAGNGGSSNILYPAAYSGVLAVSASDQNDNLAPFSSYGNNIFAAAPGVSVLSTNNPTGYAFDSGTSISTPHLSGLFAMALAYSPNISNTDLISIVKNSSDKVGAYPYDASGWNQYFGFGRINESKVMASLVALNASPTPAATDIPQPTLTETITVAPTVVIIPTATTEPTVMPTEVPTAAPTAVPPTSAPAQATPTPIIPNFTYPISLGVDGNIKTVLPGSNALYLDIGLSTKAWLRTIFTSGQMYAVVTAQTTITNSQGQTVPLSNVTPGTKAVVTGKITSGILGATSIQLQ